MTVRRVVRRFLMAWGALSLSSTLMALGFFVWLNAGAPEPKSSILHVTLDGPIREAPPAAVARVLNQDASLPLRSVVQRIRRAAQDARIVGLLLEVKAPQIGLAQLEELSRAMTEFRHSGKWSASYLETAGEDGRGDGALALASLANQVILAPPGEISLAGLKADVPFGKGLLERLHVKSHIEQRYEFKNFADSIKESQFTPAHRTALKSLLDDLQDRLVSLIATGRHTDTNTVLKWMGAGPFASDVALAEHIVDQVAYRDEVLSLAERVAGHPEPLIDLSDYHPPKPGRAQAQVAYIAFEGEISRGEAGGRPGRNEGIGSDTYAEALRQAREDGVDAAILRIDSPGGSYLASDVLRREIELLRDHNIPVVISMGNTAASGGYFIALAGDRVFAEPATVTGSIGVVSASFALRETLSHFFGVTFDSYRAVDKSFDLGFLDPPDAATQAIMSRDVDRIYRDFVGKVAQARHKTYDEVHEVAKGRVWTGRQALGHGLVDELGGLDAAEAYIRRRLELSPDAELALTNYPEPTSTLQYVRQVLNQQAQLAASLRASVGLVEPFMTRLGLAKWHFAPGIQARVDGVE